jgi:C4-dicarboxylate-specific signal transduction histidine kinase
VPSSVPDGSAMSFGSFERFTRKDPAPTKFDLNNLVTGTLPLLRSHINHHRGSVGLSLANDLPVIFADPVQIQQVLSNLQMNGLQAPRKSDAGERRLTI